MPEIFTLPQVRVTLTSGGISESMTLDETSSSPVPGHHLVLVLGGRAPNCKWLRELIVHCGCDRVWAIDSGTDACRVAGIIPERVIGDLDSVSGKGREWALENKILSGRDIYSTEKDDTDFQLAVKLSRKSDVQAQNPLCDSRNFNNIIVTGCWGGRYDHTFYNILVARQAYAQNNREQYLEHKSQVLCMADEREILIFLDATQVPALAKMYFVNTPAAISLLPLTDRVTGVTLTGVRWPLFNATLPDWTVSAISNQLLDDDSHALTVSLKSGVVGVYAAFQAGFAQKRMLCVIMTEVKPDRGSTTFNLILTN